MKQKDYLEIAIMREIEENGIIIYHYDTFFATHIYDLKHELSTEEKNHFYEYSRNLADATVNDFTNLPAQHKLELFHLKIMHPRPSIKLILLETEHYILMHIEEIRRNGHEHLRIYQHFGNEFQNARQKLRY